MNEKKNCALSICSMVLGILSLVLLCLPHICLPAGIIGFILGCVSLMTHKSGKGMAIAGIVTSMIAVGLYILTVVGVLSLLF